MRRLPGLRLRFNLVVVPIVVLGMAVMVWADYRHEYATLMEAHALHASVVGGVPPRGPLAPWSLPGPAVQRSLLMHVTYAGVLLVSLVLALNVILHLLILRPVALMRQRLAGLERGQWRGRIGTTGDDELGSLHADFQRLGPEIDALVGHALHAERLAMLALVSKRFEQHAEPEVKRIAEIASRLAASPDAEARRDGEELARAAAGILKAVHAYDGAFARSSTNATSAREKFGTRGWIGTKPRAAPLFIVLGVGYTVWSEWFNTSVRASWDYATTMPVIAGIGHSHASVGASASAHPVAVETERIVETHLVSASHWKTRRRMPSGAG